MRNNQKLQNNKVVLLATIILIVTLLVTIGYAAFSDQLTITDTVAHVRVYKLVRINGATTSSGSVSNLDYDSNSLLNTVSIPAGESVTYSVTVTNLGNVPVAVSDVSFTNGNSTISNLSSNITPNNYVKICDTNNNCTGGISKNVAVTITNNGSSTINTQLDVNLTFTEVYDISYEGNKIGEALAGSTYTHVFTSNYPNGIAKTNGTCGTYSYDNNNYTLTVNNVGSDLTFVNKYVVFYDGQEQGNVAHGNTYIYEFTSKWPKTITCTGTIGNQTYVNDILTITNVNSNVNCTPTYGRISITSITYNSSVNATDNTPPVPNGMSADFDITFQRAANATTNDFYIIYDVTLSNEYYEPYIFNGFDFDPEITASSDEDAAYIEPELIGVSQGETIPARTTKNFQLKLNLIANNPNGTYGASGSAEAEATEPTVEEGTLTATISPNTGDLRSPHTSASFTVVVTNTYESAKTYSLTSSSSNFVIVDNNNNNISKTIAGSGTDSYTVYVKKSSSAMFKDSTATMNVLLVADGMANYNVGSLTINVDISPGVDTTPPSVSNAALAMYNEGNNNYPAVGKLRATWSGQDNPGGFGLKNFTVKLYDSTNTLVESKTVGSNEFSTTFPSSGTLGDGSYYVVVYGEDNYNNSGAAYESDASSPYVSKTTAAPFKWRFAVDVTGLNNLQCNTTEAYLNQTYTCTMTPKGSFMNGDNVPDSMTSVYMGTTRLGTTTSANGYYTYTKNSDTQATLRVFNVTDVIKLTATAANSCLIEGTKVLMANGKYKNIENINYDDLLLVHNYETGQLIKEYPIWIEKEKSTETYQKNTFSDGSVLKTVGWHGLFSPELNRFITVDNQDEFHVGTKVLKLNKEKNEYDTVTVTNIEYIKETVNYYHIVSTRYYNIIANDFLTTDGTTILSNLYGFSDNIVWPKATRELAMQDMYTYDDLKETIPYYMFKGLRAEEGKFLANYGLDLKTFQKYLSKNQNNPDMVQNPIQRSGRNVWMVTTSEDNVTDLNKSNYLQYEGTEYTLPKSKKNNLVGWLNTSDNKIYSPSDTITIYHGTHFEAVYK